MSELSEEEIIDKINYMINNWHRNVLEINIEWIQGILDLYNKEKEKNEYALLEKEQLLEDSVSKDKIREKINKYNEIRQKTNDDDVYYAMVNYIDILEELLEE